MYVCRYVDTHIQTCVYTQTHTHTHTHTHTQIYTYIHYCACVLLIISFCFCCNQNTGGTANFCIPRANLRIFRVLFALKNRECICLTWRVSSSVWHDSESMCLTWLILMHVRDMPHSHASLWYDSFLCICGTWFDLFVRVTVSALGSCHSYVWHDFSCARTHT